MDKQRPSDDLDQTSPSSHGGEGKGAGCDSDAENERTVSVSDAVRARPLLPIEAVESIGGYRILGVLGEGGMGVVYEAEQSSPQRHVALKVMRRGHTVDEVHARMFHHEAQTLARLRHPKIAAIYESGHTFDGHDFFAMELVRGKTLASWLESRSASLAAGELRTRLRLFHSICEPVHYAHQRGVIHNRFKFGRFDDHNGRLSLETGLWRLVSACLSMLFANNCYSMLDTGYSISMIRIF